MNEPIEAKRKLIVQILRAPVGGIRKHVVSLVGELETTPGLDWLWVTSTERSDIDEGFISFVEDSSPKVRKKIKSLKINDQPELRDIKNIISLVKQLKGQAVDVVHGHGAKGGLYARVVGFLIGAKVIYTPHGGSLHDMFGPLKSKVYCLVEKALKPLTDLFVFESLYSQNQFYKKISKDTKKFYLNRNGVSLPALRLPNIKKSGAPWILGSFGALRFLKGHDLVIEALPLLRERGIECCYFIYGEGEEKQNLESLAIKNAMDANVQIFEKTKDVYGAISKVDIVLQPSRHESFGYVPLEAMSIGRPVIASNQGGLPEVVKHDVSGLLVDKLTPEAFAQAIEKMVSDEELRNQLIKNGRESVKMEFSEKKMLTNLTSLYENL